MKCDPVGNPRFRVVQNLALERAALTQVLPNQRDGFMIGFRALEQRTRSTAKHILKFVSRLAGKGCVDPFDFAFGVGDDHQIICGTRHQRKFREFFPGQLLLCHVVQCADHGTIIQFGGRQLKPANRAVYVTHPNRRPFFLEAVRSLSQQFGQ